jgi:hypothetical protein
MSREEKLRRYRSLRAINTRQQSDALDFISQTAMLDCARRLGLACGRSLVLDNPDELTLAFDLMVHTARGGRRRGIDRYAEKVRPPPGSDEEFMLTAARNAKFAVWQVEQRHQEIGLRILDIVSNEVIWLIDESLEASCPDGHMFASRLIAVDDFVMTCGVVVPIDELVILEAWKSMPRWSPASQAEMVQDPRFAMGIFRAAIRTRIMDGVRYIDPTKQDLLEAMRAG